MIHAQSPHPSNHNHTRRGVWYTPYPTDPARLLGDFDVKEVVNAVEVVFNSETKEFEVIEKLPAETNTKKIWNTPTNQFIPVSLVMYSPNYWEKKIGNKHIFFILKDCQNPENPNAFYKEYLIQELAEHGKVLSAIGTKKAIAFDENQLSGIGFSDTKHNELIVRVEGKTKRILKIKF